MIKDNTLFLKKLIEFTGTKYEVSWIDNGDLNDLVIIIDNKIRISREEVEMGFLVPFKSEVWTARPLDTFPEVDCDDCRGSHHAYFQYTLRNPIEVVIYVIQALEAIEIRHKIAQWIRENNLD